ncbi:MAG: type III-A CRISPR-associated RAMP protein Csm5 [Bacteroidetes bacterium]|nr:type III-A CRISPR-associated RAMP protein Csm5 [Bacteroidota bacterium]
MIKLNFNTLTPLHISNGNDLSFNIEYIEKDQKFCKLKINKAAKKYTENNLFDFSISYSFSDYIKIIEKNKNILYNSDFEYSLETSRGFLEHLKNTRADGQKIVKEFNNSNGKFYIPGSSVKGSIATIMGLESIGIQNNINEKFVIRDSDSLDSSMFLVLKTFVGRPPISLICLKSGSEFSLSISKYGMFNLSEFKKKLKIYYQSQILKAKIYAKKYFPNPTRHGESGAELFFKILAEAENWLSIFGDDEFLINLGFGSGTYFKLFESVDKIPTNWNRKSREEEEPHTTFSFFDGEYLDHIGWCKLTIEEE